MSNWKLEIDGEVFDLDDADDSESGAAARLAVWERRNEIGARYFGVQPRVLRIVHPAERPGGSS